MSEIKECLEMIAKTGELAQHAFITEIDSELIINALVKQIKQYLA